jgi:hypothetical protein
MADNTPKIKLKGIIRSDYQGICSLMNFYSEARKYSNTDLIIDCYDLLFIDANLTALLNAIDYKLNKLNNISLKTDFKFLTTKFGVLFRNGWLEDENFIIEDVQKTTIPCSKFTISEEVQFVLYIKEKLLKHRGMKISENLRLRIETDLIEIYNNICTHSKSNDPFFVSGQYYPKLECFKFTIVDLGVGFLEPIYRYTNGKVKSHIDAIKWALNGNSTTGESLAGLGLQSIYEYSQTHFGDMQIYSGNAFWGTNIENRRTEGFKLLKIDFQGSMINLFFKFKQ